MVEAPRRAELLELRQVCDPDLTPYRVQFRVRWHSVYLDVLSNGMRLSCGAELKCSQTEFYHTAGLQSFGSIEDGRRQLQARVRRTLQSNAPCCATRTARSANHRR